MIRTGDYSIEDIKSFFTKHYNHSDEIEDDDIEIGEIIELRVSDNPPIDIIVEIINIEDGGLLIAEILEVNGLSEDHAEGDIIFIPTEIFE